MYKSLKEREEFYSQPKLSNPKRFSDVSPDKVYKLAKTGQTIYETQIDSGLNLKEPIEIAQLTDMHFNYVNEEDKDDEEIMLTLKHRHWQCHAYGMPGSLKAVEAAAYSDLLVVTGDSLDFLSKGAMELMQKCIWDKFPDALCSLGGHELTKHLETGCQDKLTLEERYDILKDFWKHDIFYATRLVKDKVLCVSLDNSRGAYHPSNPEKLREDIKRARANGYIILLFQHEPLTTGNPNDKQVESKFLGDTSIRVYNFYDPPRLIGSPLRNNTPADEEMLELIKTNADVIKCVFNGHMHNVFCTDILATYTEKDGTVKNATIKQLTNTSNIYFNPNGNIVRIIVK